MAKTEPQKPYVHQEWPRVQYSAECPTGKMVYSQAEDDELGPGWVDSPAKINPAALAKAQKASDVGNLQDEIARLKAELAAALGGPPPANDAPKKSRAKRGPKAKPEQA